MTHFSFHLQGTLLRCAFAGALALLFSACSAEPSRDLLAEAEILCLDQEWDAAKVLLREHLLVHPDDAAAHFYLGRCYLMAGPGKFRPDTAEGEFQTALRIFRRNGRVNPIERFADADYFEYICQMESAKVFLNLLDVLFGYNRRVAEVQEYVERGKAYVDLAAAVLPDDPDVEVYERMFKSLQLDRSD